MERRPFLTGLGLAGMGLLAGCLHSGGLTDEELDAVSMFLEDSIILLSDARARIDSWQKSPADADAEPFQELADEASTLLETYDSDIEPILESVEDSEFERTYDNQEWTVEGSTMRDVLEAQRPASELAETACGGIAEADADPDAIDDETSTAIEDFMAESETPLQNAQAVWYEGGL